MTTMIVFAENSICSAKTEASQSSKKSICPPNNTPSQNSSIFIKSLREDKLIITDKDLSDQMEYWESSEIDWHLARGLSTEYASRKDIIVMSAKERDERFLGKTELKGARTIQRENLMKEFRIEIHEFGINSQSEGSTPKMHKLRMDSPPGTAVFQTDEQYKVIMGRYGELLKKYNERIFPEDKAKRKNVDLAVLFLK